MDNSEKKNPTHINQWIATLGVFMFLVQMGIIATWTSPNIAYLTGPDSPIPLTPDQASWLASLSSIGSIVGSIVGSLVNMAVGSKKTILCTFIVFGVSWTTLIIGNSMAWLYLARILAGVAHGAVHTCFSLYLGEISSPETRGTLISIAYIGGGVGGLMGTSAETYLDMKVSSSIYLSQCVVGIAMFAWLVDSPYHHMKRKDHESAKRSIAFYDRHGDADKKFNEIKDYMESKIGQNFKDNLREFASPEVRKSLLVIIILYAIPHLAGAHVIVAYMETILIGSQSTLIDPQIFIIIINCSGLLLAFLTHRLIDQLGRRILLIISATGLTVGLMGLGIHYFLLRNDFNMQHIQWLPHGSVLVAILFYSIGCSTVPSTVLSEIFTSNTKSIAACVASLTASLGTFVSVKAYQPIVDSFGEAYAFWLYAVIAMTLVPFALFSMVETKGKSFQEIQNLLTRRNKITKCKEANLNL